MTRPTPSTHPDLSHSDFNTVSDIRQALVTLIESGVSLSDPRLQTFLSLFRQYSQHPPKQHHNDDHNIHINNYNTSTPANSYQPAPSHLLPIAAKHLHSSNRSFLPHNQSTIVAARIALESKSKPQQQPTENVLPNAPPSVFRAANQLTRSVSFSSERIGDVNALHAFQIKAQAELFRRVVRGVDVPTELRVAASGPLNPPNNYQKNIIKPLSAPILQRGLSDPDVNSKSSTTDPSLTCATPEPFDPRNLPRFPCDYTITEKDVILPGEQISSIPKPDLNERLLVARIHHRQIHFKIQQKEQEKVQQNLKQNQQLDESLSLPLENIPIDGKIRQQRAELLSKLNPNISSSPIPVPPSNSNENVHIQSNKETNHRQNLQSSLATIKKQTHKRRQRPFHHSVSLQRAAVPITVASTPLNVPSLEALQQAREKRIATRLHSRLQEISEMLPTASDDVRRILLIEQKQLRLLPLQMRTRRKVMICMHRALYRPGISDLNAKRVLRLRRKLNLNHQANFSMMNGINTNGLPSSLNRQESVYREQQARRRKARRANMLQNLIHHGTEFKAFVTQRVALRKKLMKDLERYFRDRSREEERRKKKEQLDRLRALRNNNEDEYLELLKTTKNQRLIQLLRQTDEYLVQIGAQVERQKQTARDQDSLNQSNGKLDDANNNGSGDDETRANGDDNHSSNSDEDDLSQLKKRRKDYYTITHTISEKVHQPKSLIGGTLKHYQVEGLEWLVSLYNNNLNGILADEMGLGKTIQTIALITYLLEVKNVFGPFLVIVPLSVMSNWTRELDRWAPSLVSVIYKGDPSTRKQIQSTQMHGGNYNVLLTTYEFVVKDKNVLGRVRWKYIIMDEGHRMKNADCKLALTLGAKYTSRNRLLLTGTPLQNNMTELWALLNFLLPSIFSSAETFETWFNAPFQEATLGDSAELNEEENLLIISRLHQVLRPFMLRRLKTDVETQLPDKVEIVFRCKMSIWQRVLYRQMSNKLGIAGGGGSNNVTIRSFNNIMMQLKKVCNHPFLFYQDDELMSLPRDYLIRAAGKFEFLHHVLKKLHRTGHRVLIFSQMTSALDWLEYFLNTIDMTYLRLDGTTKADDRQSMLELFNAKDSQYFCFLLSTRAGGLGLNLQTADTVIIFDSDWNPMMDLQAQDRAHRIGQTKEVRVFRLICSGSVEVKILERATRKLQIESQVIQAGQFNNKSSDNDRHEMLKDLLRQNTEDDFARKDVTSLDEINQNLARGDHEIEIFEAVDEELKKEWDGRSALLESEDDVPKWVLKPEEEMKQRQKTEADHILEHGRGRRKRKQVMYDDNLTEKEWTMAMEEEGDVEEAIKRKKRKLTQLNGKNSHSVNSDDEDDNNNDDGDDDAIVDNAHQQYNDDDDDDDDDDDETTSNRKGRNGLKKKKKKSNGKRNPAPTADAQEDPGLSSSKRSSKKKARRSKR